MGLLIPNMLGHAKALSEDYLHQVKKKTLGLDAICLWIPPFSYYLLHVPVRIIPVALLFAHRLRMGLGLQRKGTGLG